MFKAHKKKRLLLVAPIYFGYEREIIAELEDFGFLVDWLPDRPFTYSVMRGLTTLCPLAIQPLVDRINEKFLINFGISNYDFIVVINGQTISERFLSELRRSFPHAKLILYMWDAFKNRKNILSSLYLFDNVFTFDQNDAKNFGINFRPLFFSKGFHPSNKKTYKYDVSFVGTIHSDRYRVLKKFENELPHDIRYYSYKYLQAPWVYYLYKFKIAAMREAHVDEFQYSPLKKFDLYEVFLSSKAVLDIEHPNQSGLTMRTFETLGSEKKLITTNKNIKNYDFYNTQNICVIDRGNPKLPEDFFLSDYKSLPPDIYEKYSISGWLTELLGTCKADLISDIKKTS